MPFGTKELEWCGYPSVKKFDDTFSRFDTILACDNRRTSCDSIVRAMHMHRAVKKHLAARALLRAP